MRHLIETSRVSAPPPSRGPGDRSSHLQIELLVCLIAFLLVFLVTFGSCRRRCNNGRFMFIMFAAYTTSTYVLTYALGLMRQRSDTNIFFAVWAMFLMVAHGSADSFSAYHLQDNEEWKKYNWQLGINFVWLAVLLSSYRYVSTDTQTLIALDCLIIVLVLKSHERSYALVAASTYSIERSAKLIVDYMCEKHKEHNAAEDAGDFCMKNCYYLVRGEEDKWEKKRLKEKMRKPAPAPDYLTRLENEDEVVTLEKVWKCEEGLLSSEGDPDNKIKDYCLSFALFKLLRLRYAGYSLPQAVLRKTWTLIKNELLSQQDGRPNDYRRAFRVVEIELSYLFDFFYTKYAVIFHPGRFGLKLVGLIYFSIGIYATKLILDNYPGDTDTSVTTVMILAFIVAELVQLFFTCFSEWAKLTCVCNYVQKKSWQKKKWIERMVKFVCQVQILRPWERKLGQYSFLESYTYRPCGLIYNRISASYINQKRNGQKQSKAIELTKDVKEAVFLAMARQNYGANLANGRASLQRNKVPNLLWACELETQTQVLLVWHIATSFCKHEVTPKDKTGNLGIATKLSNYLAYLVVFAPRLLPDHSYTTGYVFDQAILEARIFFEKCRLKCKCKSKKKKMQARIDQMKKQDEPSVLDKQTVIQRGVRLGNQIVNEVKEADLIWKVLADFWVEMMLYVAPSDNAKAHAEHLTRGGEFVTHLWALLHHAGIERCVPSEPTAGPDYRRSNSSPN